MGTWHCACILYDMTKNQRVPRVSPSLIIKIIQFASVLLLSGIVSTNCFAVDNSRQYEEHAHIISTVKRFISSHVQKIHKGEFTIKVGRIDPRHRLARCSLPLEAQLTGNNFRSSAMTVAVRCAKPSPWLLYVPGKVSIYKTVFIARHTITRGRRILASDLHKSRRDITTLHYGYIDNQREIVGKIARRVVFANTVLKPQMLSLPLLVKRGQTVILIAETHGIQVRMSGKALGSGPAGHSIRVRNLSSRRIVEGIVVKSGVVKIGL